jgi:hypothetical protein
MDWWSSWFFALAMFASIRNAMYHIKHDDHESMLKWTVMALLFVIALIISLFT